MSEFSERMEKYFFELYTTTDLLMVIVRGHLYCEFALSEILRGKFSNPKEINIDRLDYRAKVNLCSALGCFDSINLKQGLIMLGEMRNKYVHNLYYKVTDQDQLNFVNTLKSSLGKPSKVPFGTDHGLLISPATLPYPFSTRRSPLCHAVPALRCRMPPPHK